MPSQHKKAASPTSSPVSKTRKLSVEPGVLSFSLEANGIRNTAALQALVDQGGSISITQPGTYKIAGTVYLGSNTSLHFGSGVFLKKVPEKGPFTHVLLNKGALTRTWDHNIAVSGLHIIVNEVDIREFDVCGLHGQLAFFYIKDLRVERFRCMDLGPTQYGIHVCTFEDIIIDDVQISGLKDGVHLGSGRRFTIRNGVFQTFDDAIALNGHDYWVGNPELGWIENGLIENCHDLSAESTTGYFCRILAGAWRDWQPDMELQNSDTVVHRGKIYRVQGRPDGTPYVSKTAPTHDVGVVTSKADGIPWGMMQEGAVYNAGVRNVSFRDIFLYKPRTAFSVHFDIGIYSRSYYPGAVAPVQGPLHFQNIQMFHNETLLRINTPVRAITLQQTVLRKNTIHFCAVEGLSSYGRSHISMANCVFEHSGSMDLLVNSVPQKEIVFQTAASSEVAPRFKALIHSGKGRIKVISDLNHFVGT